MKFTRRGLLQVVALAAAGQAVGATPLRHFLPRGQFPVYVNIDQDRLTEIFKNPDPQLKDAVLRNEFDFVTRYSDSRVSKVLQMCPMRSWSRDTEARKDLLNLHTLIVEGDKEQVMHYLRQSPNVHVSEPRDVEWQSIPSDHYANVVPGTEWPVGGGTLPSYHWENYVVGLYDAWDRIRDMLAQQNLTINDLEKTIVACTDTSFLPLHPDMCGIELIDGHLGINLSDATGDDLYVIEPLDGMDSHGIGVQGVLYGMWDGGDDVSGAPGGITGHSLNMIKALLMASQLPGDGYWYRGPVESFFADAVDLGAKVLNYSAGYGGEDPRDDPILGPIFQYVFDNDLTLVASAPNNPDYMQWPCKMAQVIGVGGTITFDYPIDNGFLTMTPEGVPSAPLLEREDGRPVLLAPKGLISFNHPNDPTPSLDNPYYGMFGGNSCSTPLVSALVGIIRTMDPSMDTHRVMDFLYKTGRNVSGLEFQIGDDTLVNPYSQSGKDFRVINIDNVFRFWDRRYDDRWLGIFYQYESPRRPSGRAGGGKKLTVIETGHDMGEKRIFDY